MIITLIDIFYIGMIAFIVTFLVVIEVQVHTMKSQIERYIDVRLNPDRDKISKIKCTPTKNPLTK